MQNTFSTYANNAFNASCPALFAQAANFAVQLVNAHFYSRDFDDTQVFELLQDYDTALANYVEQLDNDTYSKLMELVFVFNSLPAED